MARVPPGGAALLLSRQPVWPGGSSDVVRRQSRVAARRSAFLFLASARRRDLSRRLPESRCSRPLFSPSLRCSFIPLLLHTRFRISFSSAEDIFYMISLPANRNKISESRNHHRAVPFRLEICRPPPLSKLSPVRFYFLNQKRVAESPSLLLVARQD